MGLKDSPARQDWLARRRRRLGGSDIGALLWLSPHRDAHARWAEKTGRWHPDLEREPDELETMGMGHRMEPVCAGWYAEDYAPRAYGCGVTVEDQPYEILQHPDFPWWLGSRDRKIVGHPLGYRTLECKNMDRAFLEEWDAGGPEHHLCQLQWYIGAEPGNPGGVLAGIIGGRYPRAIESPRNDRLIREMGLLAEEFWLDYVVKDREPPATGMKSSRAVLKHLHPKDNGETIVLSPSFEDEVVAWENAKATAKIASEAVELHGNRLRQAVGDATYAKAGLFTLSYKHQTQPAEKCEHCGKVVRDAIEKRTLLRLGARKKNRRT